MNEEPPHSPIYLQPYEGESISHYLGRWRRQETVSVSNVFSLSRKLRLGTALTRWEKFMFNPYPSEAELAKLSAFIGLEVDELLNLFPPKGEVSVKPGVVRFCPTCYIEAPYHRVVWQLQSTAGCRKHRLLLLSRCPDRRCGKPIPIPALWVHGKCEKCGMPYEAMAEMQKPYEPAFS